MTKNPSSVERPRIIGLDVAKALIVVYDPPSGRTLTIPNRPDALRKGLQPFADYELWVCEATGGYERAVLDTALELGAPAHRADAERGARLSCWTKPNPHIEAFAALVRLRQDVLHQRTQTKNRRAAPACGPVVDLLDAQIAFLNAQIKTIEAKLKQLLKAQPGLAKSEAALRAIPGIGPVVARTLIALLPEIGTLSRKQAASLAGLAPHPNESGAAVKRRRMTGGRASIRSTLFMASLSAARTHPRLKEFYQRLVAAGKPKRLALAAVSRKLVVIANAVLKEQNMHPQLT